MLDDVTATCTACDSGKFSGQIKSSTCIDCAAAQYSLQAAPVCTDCPSNSNSPALSNKSTDCKCNTGYSGPDGEACSACEAGKYKAIKGHSDCLECPQHTYNPQTASNRSDACLACPFIESPDICFPLCCGGSWHVFIAGEFGWLRDGSGWRV